MLLRPRALAGGQQKTAALSCHCNPITYLLPSCRHRVPSLGHSVAGGGLSPHI